MLTVDSATAATAAATAATEELEVERGVVLDTLTGEEEEAVVVVVQVVEIGGGGWRPRKDSRADGSLSKQHLIKFSPFISHKLPPP
jgi:hypothetical protein